MLANIVCCAIAIITSIVWVIAFWKKGQLGFLGLSFVWGFEELMRDILTNPSKYQELVPGLGYITVGMMLAAVAISEEYKRKAAELSGASDSRECK